MSKSERDSAARRKRAADPNQPQKSGAAKPTNVSTDPKKKMSENYFSEKKMAKVKLNPEKKIGVKVTDIGPGGKEVVKKNTMNEAKDKKGKGSGTKDACYHKVKSRYSVWPSAYASGALVKCRKVGAANWGNKSKNEGFSPMQVSALEAAGMIEIKEGQKCWKGYEKKGTKMMFGKRYNNCVKKKATKEEVEHIDEKMMPRKMKNVTPMFGAARNEVRMQAVKSLAKDAVKPIKGSINQFKRSGAAKPLGKAVKASKAFAVGAAGLGAGMEVAKRLSKDDKKTTNEGVEFLKREKEKKKSKSEYLGQRDAGKLAKRKMAKKDQEKVNFLEPEETNESTQINEFLGKVYGNKFVQDTMFMTSPGLKSLNQLRRDIRKKRGSIDQFSRGRGPQGVKGGPVSKFDQLKLDYTPDGEPINEKQLRLVKNGHAYKVVLTWRGKTYMVQMFIPSVTRPTRQEVEKQVQKLYPDAKVMSFLPRDLEPGEPTVMVGEEKRDEYGDIVGGPKISKKQKAKNLAKNEKDEDHTTTTAEEYVTEDDMKGMSVKSGHKRPTKKGAGMTQKGVEAYRRRNPGSKLKTAVTGKVKKGSKDAKRRKSYCARSAGQMKKFPKAAKDPNSRLRQARRRWKC